MEVNRTRKRNKKQSIHIMVEDINDEYVIERIYKLVEYLYKNQADN